MNNITAGTDQTIVTDDLRQAIRAAARWYALLQSPDCSSQHQADWRAWVAQDANHHLAWQQVEQVQGALASVPGQIAAPALRGAALSRRELLQRLGIIAVAAPLGLTAWQLSSNRPRGQYQTDTGQQRTLALNDGGQLILNTSSAVDITYSDTSRIISLYQGEIHMQTAADRVTPPRPFYVDTPHGRVQALGTRFTVRIDDQDTRVSVQQDTVRIRPAHSPNRLDISAGQQLRFNSRDIGTPRTAKASDSSWINGSLMVVDQPLRQVLNELARYRKGMLSCSDSITGLKISGSFPLQDTDRALAVISRAFPVRELRLTGYFVRMIPA